MPSIKAIAYNFVTERCSGEVMALGINSVREIARRIPALLEEEGMDALVLVSLEEGDRRSVENDGTHALRRSSGYGVKTLGRMGRIRVPIKIILAYAPGT